MVIICFKHTFYLFWVKKNYFNFNFLGFFANIKRYPGWSSALRLGDMGWLSTYSWVRTRARAHWISHQIFVLTQASLGVTQSCFIRSLKQEKDLWWQQVHSVVWKMVLRNTKLLNYPPVWRIPRIDHWL